MGTGLSDTANRAIAHDNGGIDSLYDVGPRGVSATDAAMDVSVRLMLRKGIMSGWAVPKIGTIGAG
jgi:hypothetical protein